jgi:hypothetical protein
MTAPPRGFFGSHPLTRGTAHAFKVAATTLSAGAATISILTFARATGILKDTRPPRPTHANVIWVGIVPQSDTARSIGDTIQLTATLKDDHGSLVSGAPSWSVDDPTVASVDSAGMVVALKEGITTVVAAAGEKVARARVAVRPVVAAVQIQFDSSFRVPEGERRPAAAVTLDARGHPLAGWPVQWSSSDSSIARIDSSGAVTGGTPGRTMLEARVQGISTRIEIAVVPVAGSVAVVAGKGQRAQAGRALAQPVMVQVLSRGGRPMDGVPVRFAAEPASTEETALTDAAGRARSTWTLAERPGRQRLMIVVSGLDSVVAVTAEADPVPANTRLVLSSPVGGAPAGDTLATPVVVGVTDSTGAPLADIPVNWLALDGGKITAIAERTDSLGHARATWRLGSKAGSQRIRVQVGDSREIPALTIKSKAEPGSPYALTLVSGGTQSGGVSSALKAPIAVRVSDRFGNRISGVPVVLRAEAGSVSDSTVTTDSAGVAYGRWTLGNTAGTQRLTVHASPIEKALVVTAKGLPRSPASLGFSSPPAQGSVGRSLPQLKVVLKDAYGNPISNRTVTFAPVGGKVSPARVVTDAHGVAATRWTLGEKPGIQTLAAAVKDSEVKAKVTVKAVKPPPTP